MNLLPFPRSLRRRPGRFVLAGSATLRIDASLPRDAALAAARRLKSAAKEIGVEVRSRGQTPGTPVFSMHIGASGRFPARRPGGYALDIDSRGVRMASTDVAGLHAALATLRQLLREFGRRLPCLAIHDWPDFPRRGVLLDVSRGRVPRLETLLELVEHLADFKINEFQLYTEHTFAYRDYRAVWRDWGALTGAEIRALDAHCRARGIDLVPNQNSLGHMRPWLEYPPLKELAEVSEPYAAEGGDFLRYPSTLAPNHPDTLPFLRRLYDELLPNFSSRRFNVGCDEPWDLGRGRSEKPCKQLGQGRVYLRFLRHIHRALRDRNRQMMFWGDIVLRHPELIRKLPRDVIALDWGYEADHPFGREAARFAKAGVCFYVCPGTSTWMTLIGRHDNALANLRSAARAGLRQNAAGYLVADWGDGGHPQPLAVSYAPYLAGAALSWCQQSFDPKLLAPVLNREVFHDPTGCAAKAALALGVAHRRLQYRHPNLTPLGAVIAAPPPAAREGFCRGALEFHARIGAARIRAAFREIMRQREVLRAARPATRSAAIRVTELDLAARMAAQSCQYMLWQKARASGKKGLADRLARQAIRELQRIDRDFKRYWPLRNKATTAKCSMFLAWRVREYRSAAGPNLPSARSPGG